MLACVCDGRCIPASGFVDVVLNIFFNISNQTACIIFETLIVLKLELCHVYIVS